MYEAEFAGAHWRKSSHSGGGNDCVEVAGGTSVGVRDSKNATGPTLEFAPGPWLEFLGRYGR